MGFLPLGRKGWSPRCILNLIYGFILGPSLLTLAAFTLLSCWLVVWNPRPKSEIHFNVHSCQNGDLQLWAGAPCACCCPDVTKARLHGCFVSCAFTGHQRKPLPSFSGSGAACCSPSAKERMRSREVQDLAERQGCLCYLPDGIFFSSWLCEYIAQNRSLVAFSQIAENKVWWKRSSWANTCLTWWWW